ncbi:MAG: YfaP family protein [Gemmatimonadales bacterium]
MRNSTGWSGGLRVALVGLLMIGLAGCEGGLKESKLGSIDIVVSGVTTEDGTVAAALLSGAAPASSGGPAITVNGIATAINGGSMLVNVTSATPFSKVVVAMQFFDGYYEITLPAAVDSTSLIINFSEEAPKSTVHFLFRAASGATWGDEMAQPVNILRVGSGDVQVSVSWDAPTDVDLHVIDPDGEEIYFGNLTSASGGTLDLDSNPACNLDNINNENVVWPTGTAPSGTYTVFLDYWSDCSQPVSNYVVTVLIRGQPAQIFSGSMTTTGQQAQIGTFTK